MFLKITIDRERADPFGMALVDLDLAETTVLYIEAVAVVAVRGEAIDLILRDLPLLIGTRKRKAKRASLTIYSWNTYLHYVWEEATEEGRRKEEIAFELKVEVEAVEGLPRLESANQQHSSKQAQPLRGSLKH